MTPPERDTLSARAWLGCVDRDLDSARKLAHAEGAPEVICFLCQQAAEKALKAYLAWLSEEPIPFFHDLVRLGELLESRGGAAPPREALLRLTPYSVAPRYPSFRPILPHEAPQALAAATEVVDFVYVATGLGQGPSVCEPGG